LCSNSVYNQSLKVSDDGAAHCVKLFFGLYPSSRRSWNHNVSELGSAFIFRWKEDKSLICWAPWSS
jgi:hypothetical protein